MPRSARIIRVAEGFTLGVGIWVLLLTLGVPWMFHLGGFDGLLPCAIGGAVLGWYDRRVLIVGLGAALSIVLLIVAFTPVISGPVHALVREDPLPPHADAVMALSAGVNDDGTISQTSVDRLLKAIELVTQGVAPTLVVSREVYLMDGKTISSRQEQERIISLSRPGLSHMIVAGVTHSTHDEAMRARSLFTSNRWKRIVVVTSPTHTRRACAAFEKAGVVVSCAASKSRGLALEKLASPEDRVSAFQLWLYEIAGTIRYRQLGWI